MSQWYIGQKVQTLSLNFKLEAFYNHVINEQQLTILGQNIIA